MVTMSAKRKSNLARNAFIAFVTAGVLLLFASARAESVALPVAGMIRAAAPVPALLHAAMAPAGMLSRWSGGVRRC